MTDTEILYYKEMLERNRLLPLFVDKKLKWIFTYFIGNGNIEKYQKRDMWTIIDDEPKTGNTLYIDQCISDHKNNSKYNRTPLNILINHIKVTFPQVKQLRWNRFKNGIVKTYKKEI